MSDVEQTLSSNKHWQASKKNSIVEFLVCAFISGDYFLKSEGGTIGVCLFISAFEI